MRAQTQRALLGAYKLIKRQRASIEARVTHQLQQNLNDRRGCLGVVAAVFAAAAVGDDGGIRRVIQRATDKWRGSTLFVYTRGDDATFCSSFHTAYRCSSMDSCSSSPGRCSTEPIIRRPSCAAASTGRSRFARRSDRLARSRRGRRPRSRDQPHLRSHYAAT